MKAPSSTAGRIAVAAVAVSAGASVGALIGSTDRSPMRPVSVVGGAMFGSLLVGFLGIVTAVANDKFKDTGLMTGLVGVGLPIGAGVVSGIAGFGRGGASSAPALPPTPVQLTLMPGGGGQPGSMSAAVSSGGSLVLSLPTGATWVSLQDSKGGVIPVSASSPATLTVTAAETLTASWTDLSSTRQSTTIAVTTY